MAFIAGENGVFLGGSEFIDDEINEAKCEETDGKKVIYYETGEYPTETPLNVTSLSGNENTAWANRFFN